MPFLSVSSWVVYDLANTIFSLNIVSIFLSLWVVNVMGGTDAVYGNTMSISMAAIFVLSPFLGALTDQSPRRMPFLVCSTMVCIIFTVLLGRWGVYVSLIAFAIANAAYQAGLQFYDALLPEVSTERNRGKISGIGVAVGYVGSFIGIMTGRMLLAGSESMPAAQQTGKYVEVFTATALLFLVFAIPCFVFVGERERIGRRFTLGSIPMAFKQVLETLTSGARYPGLIRFLVGRAFYTDCINTVILFMSLYVVNEVGYSSDKLFLVFTISIVFAMVGGVVWGRVVDWIGPKKTLNIVLMIWASTLTWAVLVGALSLPGDLFWPVPVLSGISMGGTWAADRPYMLRLTPPARIGEFYGLYGMVGRFSAITGPFLWGLVADTLGLGRPAALATLALFIIIAYLILRPVSDKKRRWRGSDLVRTA